MKKGTIFLAAAAVVGAAGVVGAKELSIELPPESATLVKSELPGYALASGYCVLCHSVDYPLYQPPNMPRKFWEGEVAKMVKVYGAPIPASDVGPIADYLVKTYGAEKGTSGSK